MPDEDQRAPRLWSFSERFRQRHDRHGARPIVVRAVPDTILFRARGHPPGAPRAARTVVAAGDLAFRVADVIVVRAERDVAALQLRIAALDHADDVLGELGADDLIVGVHVEGDRRAGTSKRRQLFLRGRLPLQLVVLTGAWLKRKVKNASFAVTVGGTGASRRLTVVKSAAGSGTPRPPPGPPALAPP